MHHNSAGNKKTLAAKIDVNNGGLLGLLTYISLYKVSMFSSADIFHIQELSSMFLQVKTAFGLRLQYSWKEFRLYLQAEELWKDDTVGLCGTFNGNIQDDFL